MFRSYFEENGTTAKWKTLYRKLNDEQKERLRIRYLYIVWLDYPGQRRMQQVWSGG